jgi:hypothetical protein
MEAHISWRRVCGPFPAELVIVDLFGPEVAQGIVDTAVLEAPGYEAIDELADGRACRY